MFKLVVYQGRTVKMNIYYVSSYMISHTFFGRGGGEFSIYCKLFTKDSQRILNFYKTIYCLLYSMLEGGRIFSRGGGFTPTLIQGGITPPPLLFRTFFQDQWKIKPHPHSPLPHTHIFQIHPRLHLFISLFFLLLTSALLQIQYE